MVHPLVQKEYLLEKYPGKGGWTYAAIPEVSPGTSTPFGWVRVRGSIDGVAFRGVKLMPMGNGLLFFPVRAELRRKIGKEAGDWVTITLYPDDAPTELPAELMECLADEPEAYKTFLSYTEGQQKEFVGWIYAARTDEKKAERIVATIGKLLKHETLRTKKER